MPVPRPFVVALTLALSAAPALAATEPRAPSLADVSQSLAALAARVAPAVVEIDVRSIGPIGEEGAADLVAPRRLGGSGVLVSADGDIVTNAHVVAGARRIVITLAEPPDPGYPGRSLLKPAGRRIEARVVGVDLETDLALLHAETSNAPHLEFGDSDALRPGQLVLALGSPLGLSNSVSLGVVSAVGRQLEPEARMVYVQTDAPINPGNSGGALVSATGELVGINTLIYSQSGGSEGIGFAAPSNIVRHVVEQLRRTGVVRRGDLGVVAQSVTPALASGLGLDRTWGAIVSDVAPGGPAASAGLAAGDLLLELDGKPIENGRQFDVNLYQRAPGTPVRLLVQRAGQRRTVTLAIADRPHDPSRFAAMVSRVESEVPRLGVLALEVSPRVAPMVPYLRDPHGVIVAALTEPAPWSSGGGLAAGDVIHTANGKTIASLDALRVVVTAQPAGSPLVLHVNRQGAMVYVTLELE